MKYIWHSPQKSKYTLYTIFTLINPKSAAMGFFQGTQERVRNSRGKEPSVFEPLKVYYICIFVFDFNYVHVSESKV